MKDETTRLYSRRILIYIRIRCKLLIKQISILHGGMNTLLIKPNVVLTATRTIKIKMTHYNFCLKLQSHFSLYLFNVFYKSNYMNHYNKIILSHIGQKTFLLSSFHRFLYNFLFTVFHFDFQIFFLYNSFPDKRKAERQRRMLYEKLKNFLIKVF